MIDKLADYKDKMEAVMYASLNMQNLHDDEDKAVNKTRVMINYRNSCSKEVELLIKWEEVKEVEIKVLPPGLLCHARVAINYLWSCSTLNDTDSPYKWIIKTQAN